MLLVNQLNKIYESKARRYHVLKDVSFQVKQKEFVAIMGPSGSGKTTLLNCISGFIKADDGKVLLEQEEILNLDEEQLAQVRQKKLGFVFQDFMLISGLTVKENILLPQIIAKKDIANMERGAVDLMCSFELKVLENKLPSELSGGQKQRVAVARALINKPNIILADEPTGNLDSKSSLSVIKAFLKARENHDATILMVTHDAFAASYCDRVIILKDGKVIKELVRKQNSRIFLDEILLTMKQVSGDGYES
ncbi:MAG: ABC transporter ATP-binding protein [Cellulosilyticum sp.]|nr:ABC transporter ATP-binding protein [Cellulosilyticum sp.]